MSNQPTLDEVEEPIMNPAMEFKRQLQSHMNAENEPYAAVVTENSDAATISSPHTTAFSADTYNSPDVKNSSSSNEPELDASTFFTSLNPLLQSRDSTSAMPSCDVPHNQETFKQSPSQASTFELISTTSFSNGYQLVTPEASPASNESQPSFAESYTNLTAWTTKLMAQGSDQIPLPSTESLPIPLVGINHQPSIPASSAPFFLTSDLAKADLTPTYSKIGPLTPAGTSHMDLSAGFSSSGVSPVLKSKLKSTLNKEHRFKKTADALHKSGLWEVAMKTGNLIKRNRELQKELEQFRADALLFLKSVIKNPQNRDFIKNVLSNVLSANGTHQKKASVMSIVVSAAAAVSVKMKTSPSTHDSGISSSSSCGSQSDHSVSNFLYTKSNSFSPGQSGLGPMDVE